VTNEKKQRRFMKLVQSKYSRPMSKHKRIIYLVSAFLLVMTAGAVSALDGHLLEVRIRGIERASAPQYLDRRVLLTYKPDNRVRLVAARFAHEEYRDFHIYSRNDNGVYFLLLDVPEEVEQLRYRLVVDGLWINDPSNPHSEEDSFGRVFSLFDLRDRPERTMTSPEIDGQGSVTFRFRTLPDRAVSVAGDFNGWDPFWHRMVETEPGDYRLTIRMPPGQHYYYYIVNGQRVLDPINQDTARDFEGFQVSTFNLPPPVSR